MRNRSRPVRALTAICALAALPGAALPTGAVTATVTGLRSADGQVLACLTADPHAFPSCDKDPDAHAIIVPARKTVRIDFGRIPAGEYAIALVHDENANGRLDKRLMMPREGFGFSRNAPVRLGPPAFASAAFEVDAAGEHQAIRMRYMF